MTTNNKQSKFELQKTWWLGMLAGLLSGISMRSDVPDEVKQICSERVADCRKWWDNHE